MTLSNEPTISEMNYVIGVFDCKSFSGSHITDYTAANAPKMKYHTSWDWLMPVVEKIIAYRFPDAISFQDTAWPRTFGMPCEAGGFMVRFNRNPVFTAGTLLEATYQAVYYFIKWYNQQKQKDGQA